MFEHVVSWDMILFLCVHILMIKSFLTLGHWSLIKVMVVPSAYEYQLICHTHYIADIFSIFTVFDWPFYIICTLWPSNYKRKKCAIVRIWAANFCKLIIAVSYFIQMLRSHQIFSILIYNNNISVVLYQVLRKCHEV